jgi:hypothetical protein
LCKRDINNDTRIPSLGSYVDGKNNNSNKIFIRIVVLTTTIENSGGSGSLEENGEFLFWTCELKMPMRHTWEDISQEF